MTMTEGDVGVLEGFIRVRGATENNLRNVDVDIPRDAIVAFTGVSGSGKSSLAFGTIYTEAQRRFLESVAPYARRLIQQGHDPHVASITGLPPAVALRQRRASATVRSTVGTVTTLSNSMRMLLSRAGTYPDGKSERLYSDSFSPNTVAGACEECNGTGTTRSVTEQSVVVDPSLSLREGAITAWPPAWHGKNLRDVTGELGFDLDRPWQELDQRDRDWLLFTDEQPVVDIHPVGDRETVSYRGTFWSARKYLLNTLATSKSEGMRKRAETFMVSETCRRCGGTGLRAEALAVTFSGLNIAELNNLPLTDLAERLRPTAGITEPVPTRPNAQSGERTEIAVSLTTDLCSRLDVLIGLGLGYLGLGRSTTTLSAGELQRLRLATQLRSGLFGVVYVLDEPSAGLHPADAEPLLEVLQELKHSGNSVFVVEHNMDVVRQADWVVDVGPGAGDNGGEVLYSGPLEGFKDSKGSATLPYLFDTAATSRVTTCVRREPYGWVRLEGIHRSNLKGVDVSFPLGTFTTVTGVSGAGKSTLVVQVLADVVREKLKSRGVDASSASRDVSADITGDDAAPVSSAVEGSNDAQSAGLNGVDRLVMVDQAPIGRTPRSNLATYTGLFDGVRAMFAATPLAKERGYTAGRFSFNVEGGRCDTCLGEGYVSVEMLFLAGSYRRCPDCGGNRYNNETLDVTYKGKTIADVLSFPVAQALAFFEGTPAVARSLQTLIDVGLGYLRLGQPATELSGGEAQRIKLATELQRVKRDRTLYVLDEPTSGLHPSDVEALLAVLNSLADAGNTVVVVEHNMRVIAQSDWVIDLGPGGGDNGGRIVASGPPERVALTPESQTGHYLATAFSSGAKR